MTDHNVSDPALELKEKAFLDACFTEYKVVRDEVLVTTSEFYRIVQFGSTTILAGAGIVANFWSTGPVLVKTLLCVGIPTLAFVFAELLTGQVARIRKAARYCRVIEEKLQMVIGDPFGIKHTSPDLYAIGWETWHDGDATETDRHLPWIYIFGIMLFFFASSCSLAVLGYYELRTSCTSLSFNCFHLRAKTAIAAGILVSLEIAKASLWYSQATQIAHPLTGPVFFPNELRGIYGVFMSIKTILVRFGATARPAGIIAVGLQATALYFGFGIGGPIVLLSVAAMGTAASMLHNAVRAQDKTSEARSWRNAAANAGIATVLAVIAASRPGYVHRPFLADIAIATLCSTLSDTMSHEMGELFGGKPRLVTTFKRVLPGANGAITLVGSTVGLIVSFALAAWAAILHVVAPSHIVALGLAGMAGNLTDSLLGATIEDRFSLSNNLVNLLSVAAAALVMCILLRWRM